MALSNSMVAHTWAAGTKPHGKSNNGNFYFDGRILYSYGSHFAVGVRLNNEQAVLNSDSYSISTSGMQSDARSAVSHFETVSVPKLQDIARDLSYVANNGAKNSPHHVAAIIAHIETHAAALIGEVQVYDRDAPDPRYADAEEQQPWMRGAYVGTGETQAARLLRFCGIPAARAAAAIKRGTAKAARNAKAEAAAERKRAKAEAVAVADMTANERDSWLASRFYIRPFDGSYQDASTAERYREASKVLFRLIKAGKAEKLSAARLGRLKGHRAAVLAILKAYDDDAAGMIAAYHAERFANWKARYSAATDDAARLAVWRSNGVNAGAYAEGSPERAELEAADAEGRRLDSAERMAKQAQQRAEWLAGGPRHTRLDGPDGTALVRRSPDGERLETSHGADVPWDHAVKAFRFIALCVARGEAFHTNGRVVRVGPFRVDSITPEGDMRAGCHTFKWSVMRELAEREGVLTLAPSDEAVQVNA